jgi:hypothetical protein
MIGMPHRLEDHLLQPWLQLRHQQLRLRSFRRQPHPVHQGSPLVSPANPRTRKSTSLLRHSYFLSMNLALFTTARHQSHFAASKAASA